MADGQVLGYFREKTRPFVRHAVDNPVVEVPIKNGSAVTSSVARSLIRKSCSDHISKPSSLTAREAKALEAFVLLSMENGGGDRDVDDADMGKSSEAGAAWAASYIFSSFFAGNSREEVNEGGGGDSVDSSGYSSSSKSLGGHAAGEADRTGARPHSHGGHAAGSRRGTEASLCVRITGAVGDDGLRDLVLHEQWRGVQRFM